MSGARSIFKTCYSSESVDLHKLGLLFMAFSVLFLVVLFVCFPILLFIFSTLNF